MDTVLISATFLVALALGLAALAHFARRDSLAGPGTRYPSSDQPARRELVHRGAGASG